MTTISTTQRYEHVKGEARAAMGAEMAEAYNSGVSIREISERYSRSYGATRAMLVEAGVNLRPRGGRPKVEGVS